MPAKAKDTQAKDTVANKKVTTTKKSTKEATKKVSSTTKKKTTTTKKATKPKVAKKESTKPVATKTKKVTTNKKTTTTTKKVSSKVALEDFQISEYYDLPNQYEKTVVKILAQTPSTLFVYWDISQEDRNQFEKQYGVNFMNETKPILIVHNETKQYSFEVEINDFANCWYLSIADSDCKYKIELGRRAKEMSNIEALPPHQYIYITSSNQIDAPNDRILFDSINEDVVYKDVKTSKVTIKKMVDLPFRKTSNPFANLRNWYKEMCKSEDISNIYDLSNPSSQNPTSTF